MNKSAFALTLLLAFGAHAQSEPHTAGSGTGLFVGGLNCRITSVTADQRASELSKLGEELIKARARFWIAGSVMPGGNGSMTVSVGSGVLAEGNAASAQGNAAASESSVRVFTAQENAAFIISLSHSRLDSSLLGTIAIPGTGQGWDAFEIIKLATILCERPRLTKAGQVTRYSPLVGFGKSLLL